MRYPSDSKILLILSVITSVKSFKNLCSLDFKFAQMLDKFPCLEHLNSSQRSQPAKSFKDGTLLDGIWLSGCSIDVIDLNEDIFHHVNIIYFHAFRPRSSKEISVTLPINAPKTLVFREFTGVLILDKAPGGVGVNRLCFLENNDIVIPPRALESVPGKLQELTFVSNKLKFDFDFGFLATLKTIRFDFKGNCFNMNELFTKIFMQSAFPETVLELNLTRNCIQEIPTKTFKYFRNLSTLDVSHNDLTFLAPNTFEGARNLRYISFTYNRISSIDPDVFAAIQPNELHLDHNPLKILDRKFLPASLRVLSVRDCEMLFICPRALANLQQGGDIDVAGNPIDSINECILTTYAVSGLHQKARIFGQAKRCDGTDLCVEKPESTASPDNPSGDKNSNKARQIGAIILVVIILVGSAVTVLYLVLDQLSIQTSRARYMEEKNESMKRVKGKKRSHAKDGNQRGTQALQGSKASRKHAEKMKMEGKERTLNYEAQPQNKPLNMEENTVENGKDIETKTLKKTKFQGVDTDPESASLTPRAVQPVLNVLNAIKSTATLESRGASEHAPTSYRSITKSISRKLKKGMKASSKFGKTGLEKMRKLGKRDESTKNGDS